MKVYTKIVIDMKTGRVEEADSFEYDGPVAECKGGGSQSSTTVVEVDKEYNARMAKIAEEAQTMSSEMYNMFKYGVPYDPTERVQTGTTTGASTQTLNPEWTAWKKNPFRSLTKEPPQYITSTSAGEPIYKTQGEINGYDPTKVVSEMQLMQKQLETEYGMLPLQEEAARLGIGLEMEKMRTGIQAQDLERQLIQTGISAQELERAKISTGLRGEELARYMIDTGMLDQDLTRSKIKQESSILGDRYATERSGLDLQRAKDASEAGILGDRYDTERQGLGLQRQQIGLESGILGTRYDTERLGLGLQQKQIGAEESLLPQRTATTRTELEAAAAAGQDRMKSIRERAPVISKLYEDALAGVDVNRRVGEAQTAVQIGFAGAQEQMARDMSRYGVNPNSGRGLAAFRNAGLAKAGALAGATTQAENRAEEETFTRRRAALGVPVL